MSLTAERERGGEFVCMCVCVCVSGRAGMCARMWVGGCACVCVRACMHACVCVTRYDLYDIKLNNLNTGSTISGPIPGLQEFNSHQYLFFCFILMLSSLSTCISHVHHISCKYHQT